jgi:hypothetical protein
MEDKPKLESASFDFSQGGNCLSSSDDFELLTIQCESSLGIDRDGGCFFVLKTEKWSIDSEQDLKELFDRINTIIEIKKDE